MNKKTMNNEKLIDDIVAMLDGSMEKGTGHVNIKVDDDNLVQMEQVNKSDEDVVKTVETIGCTTCSQ
ncbi:MAG: hypothetical protein PHC41_12505 [Lachnospiraceae bacterium]|nr:hypothetical protein [Lachnospiraceae bacterium]MDD3617028.1 hypothetical protein [Lachnospiraceae bacterium]